MTQDNALRAEAARVKEIVRQLEEGSTLQPFRLAFYQRGYDQYPGVEQSPAGDGALSMT